MAHCHEKSNISSMQKQKVQISFAVIGKLISTFVFTTEIVQFLYFLYFLNPKFQASSHLLCLCSLECVRPVLEPHWCFSHDKAHIFAGNRTDQLQSRGTDENRRALSCQQYQIYCSRNQGACRVIHFSIICFY